MEDEFLPNYRKATTDVSIWRDVFCNNSYHLPLFKSKEVIIDIGAHIGAFACACLARGGRRIICFEPDPESYSLAQTNIQRFAKHLGIEDDHVDLYGAAIWRSDRTEQVYLSPVPKSIFSSQLHPAARSTLFEGDDLLPVHALSLDVVLQPYDSVSLLKIDCEGAEWPILYTAKHISKAKRILVELHSLAWKSFEIARSLPVSLRRDFSEMTPDDLIDYLKAFGLRLRRNSVRMGIADNSRFYFGVLDFEAFIPPGTIV